MDKDERFWFDEDKKILADAMLEAEHRFNQYINEDLYLDGAYFELELRGYVLDKDFNRWKEIKIKSRYDEGEDENEL